MAMAVPWRISMVDILVVATTWWWRIGFCMVACSDCFESGHGGNHKLRSAGLSKEEEALG